MHSFQLTPVQAQDPNTLPHGALDALHGSIELENGVSLHTSSTLAVHMSSATAALAGWATGLLVSLSTSMSPRCVQHLRIITVMQARACTAPRCS